MKKLDSTRPNHILIGLGGTGGRCLKLSVSAFGKNSPRWKTVANSPSDSSMSTLPTR